MSTENPYNPPAGNANVLIANQIGEAYANVKTVADNIEKLIELSNHLPALLQLVPPSSNTP